MQSFKDMDNVLDIRAEEAPAALFQPDTVAPAEYFKIYERTPGLEPEKKLMLVVLKDALDASKTFSMQRTGGKKWFLEAEEWFNQKESELIFSFSKAPIV